MLSRTAKLRKPFLAKLAGFFQTLLTAITKAGFVETLNRPAVLPAASEFLKFAFVVVLASRSGKGNGKCNCGEK
jgi:hypothetical protein